MIYLDSASTTPLSKEVFDEMVPYLTSFYGNPNSIHNSGREARKAVDKAREQIAAAINAEPNQIIFTSGGSEANNTVIKGCGINNIISSRMEHTSSVKSIECVKNYFWEEELSDIHELVDSHPFATKFLIWKMFVNNEVGKITDVYKLGEACSGDDNCLFGTDCVQALGFERIDVKEMRCDFATFSAHKIHGPKGVGALYVKDRNLLRPLISGGVSQEFGLRGGTENVAGIVGFGKACEIAEQNRKGNRNRILYLRNLLLENLNGIEYKVNCEDDSKVLSLQLPGIDAETFVLYMSAVNIAISAGSACRNGESTDNAALIAYGLTKEEAKSTIRLSFMPDISEQEIVTAGEEIRKAVKLFGGNV